LPFLGRESPRRRSPWEAILLEEGGFVVRGWDWIERRTGGLRMSVEVRISHVVSGCFLYRVCEENGRSKVFPGGVCVVCPETAVRITCGGRWQCGWRDGGAYCLGVLLLLVCGTPTPEQIE